jgi:hypothetical protein
MTTDAILDVADPHVQSFLAAVRALTAAQWLVICKRCEAGDTAVASTLTGAREAAGRIIAGTDLHISATERQERVRRVGLVYDTLDDALGEDLPTEAREAVRAALQAVLAGAVLRTRPGGAALLRALTAPFEGTPLNA